VSSPSATRSTAMSYGDADVWRASHIAAREIVQAPRKTA
jgi:hypothetical protein